MARKPYLVLAGHEGAFPNSLEENFKAQNWNVIVARDVDTLLANIASPHCFAVLLHEKFPVPPLLLVGRGREVSDAAWVLVAEKASSQIMARAAETGISVVLVEPVGVQQYLGRMRVLFNKFQAQKEARKRGDPEPETKIKDEFDGFILPGRPLVLLAQREHAWMRETVDKLRNEGFSVARVRSIEELELLLREPDCFCVCVSEHFADNILDRTQKWQEINPDAKWVFAATKIPKELRDKAEQFGLDEFLLEPANAQEYLQRVRKLVVPWREVRAANEAAERAAAAAGMQMAELRDGGTWQGSTWQENDLPDYAKPGGKVGLRGLLAIQDCLKPLLQRAQKEVQADRVSVLVSGSGAWLAAPTLPQKLHALVSSDARMAYDVALAPRAQLPFEAAFNKKKAVFLNSLPPPNSDPKNPWWVGQGQRAAVVWPVRSGDKGSALIYLQFSRVLSDEERLAIETTCAFLEAAVKDAAVPMETLASRYRGAA